MNYSQLLGIVRHVLTAVGAVLMILGKNVDGTKWEMLSGAVLALISVIWSVMSKSPETPVTSSN